MGKALIKLTRAGSVVLLGKEDEQIVVEYEEYVEEGGSVYWLIDKRYAWNVNYRNVDMGNNPFFTVIMVK